MIANGVGSAATVMSLDGGTRLGHYEIIEPISAGGMGEVYKATDTRLDRTVAIKVLPAHPPPLLALRLFNDNSFYLLRFSLGALETSSSSTACVLLFCGPQAPEFP